MLRLRDLPWSLHPRQPGEGAALSPPSCPELLRARESNGGWDRRAQRLRAPPRSPETQQTHSTLRRLAWRGLRSGSAGSCASQLIWENCSHCCQHLLAKHALLSSGGGAANGWLLPHPLPPRPAPPLSWKGCFCVCSQVSKQGQMEGRQGIRESYVPIKLEESRPKARVTANVNLQACHTLFFGIYNSGESLLPLRISVSLSIEWRALAHAGH